MRNHAHPIGKLASALVIALGTAGLFAAAPAAHSQIYRWIDAEGSPTYSNKPPSDAAAVHDLAVIPDIPGTMTAPPEKRTAEAARPAGAAAAQQSPPTRAAVPDVLDAFNRAATSADAPAAAPAPSATPSARISVPANAPEAVRDPCLRSSDPKCYERNRAAYVPYRGYAPSAAGTLGVGATSAAAGGTLAGGSPAPGPGKITPPKASTYALPPGSEPMPPVSTRR
jgi:hypothetical protein